MSIEAVNPLTLPSLSLQERRSLPECAAVYFVLNGNEILYIGGTVNLAQRWLAHHRWYQLVEMGDGIRLAWLECSDTVLLLEIEAALIKHFQPTLNRTPVIGDKVTVSVIVTKEVHDKLKRLANSKRWSVSQTGAVLIEEGLDRADQENSAPNQKQGAA